MKKVRFKDLDQSGRLDPLYIVFEQHLHSFHDSNIDRQAFAANVVKDYLGYLRDANISVPQTFEGQVYEELAIQVNTMLVKKIYGCLSIEDYQKKISPRDRKTVKSRYQRLKVNSR